MILSWNLLFSVMNITWFKAKTLIIACMKTFEITTLKTLIIVVKMVPFQSQENGTFIQSSHHNGFMNAHHNE